MKFSRTKRVQFTILRFVVLVFRGGFAASEVGETVSPFETDFMLLSSDFSPKYCIFIVTALPFCLTAPPSKILRSVTVKNKERFFFLFNVNRSISNITTGSVDHSCLLSTTALWYEILFKNENDTRKDLCKKSCRYSFDEDDAEMCDVVALDN